MYCKRQYIVPEPVEWSEMSMGLRVYKSEKIFCSGGRFMRTCGTEVLVDTFVCARVMCMSLSFMHVGLETY